MRDDLFAGEITGLRDWLAHLPDGHDIVANLPGPSASAAETISTALRLLQNRGGIDDDFFHRLTVARPAKRTQITAVMRLCLDGDLLPVRLAELHNDLTRRLLDGVHEAHLSAARHEAPPVACQLMVIGSEQSGHWVLGAPFSPPLVVQLGPRAELIVQAPHHLSHAGARKGQKLALDRGPTDLFLIQAQPSVRRAALRVHRGVMVDPFIRFDLAPDLHFIVRADLPGHVVALSAPAIDPGASPPLIVWFQEIS